MTRPAAAVVLAGWVLLMGGPSGGWRSRGARSLSLLHQGAIAAAEDAVPIETIELVQHVEDAVVYRLQHPSEGEGNVRVERLGHVASDVKESSERKDLHDRVLPKKRV